MSGAPPIGMPVMIQGPSPGPGPMVLEHGMMPQQGMLPIDFVPPGMVQPGLPEMIPPGRGVPVMLDPNTLQPVQFVVHGMEPGMALEPPRSRESPSLGPGPPHPMISHPDKMPPGGRLDSKRVLTPDDRRKEAKHRHKLGNSSERSSSRSTDGRKVGSKDRSSDTSGRKKPGRLLNQ